MNYFRKTACICSLMLVTKLCSCLFLACLALQSCHRSGADMAKDKSGEGVDSMAVACYKMQAEGRFDDYVKAMKSCDKMPADYQHRMVMMLRHHQKQVLEEKKGVKDVAVLRTEMHNQGRMANVFLNVTFNDGTTEEVIFPMVYDGQRWRVQ